MAISLISYFSSGLGRCSERLRPKVDHQSWRWGVLRSKNRHQNLWCSQETTPVRHHPTGLPASNPLQPHRESNFLPSLTHAQEKNQMPPTHPNPDILPSKYIRTKCMWPSRLSHTHSSTSTFQATKKKPRRRKSIAQSLSIAPSSVLLSAWLPFSQSTRAANGTPPRIRHT